MVSVFDLGAYLVPFSLSTIFIWKTSCKVNCAYDNWDCVADIFLKVIGGSYNIKENILLVQWPNGVSPP